ncbi:TPA: hypothetical protein ACNH3R_003710 [Serratia marcescens]|uniref:hypothetical protein n=2 Tax=Serratia marcescens TaxID=615 RepID=UPI0016603D7A|nr:hypothetical protein [Serratia marcescens]
MDNKLSELSNPVAWVLGTPSCKHLTADAEYADWYLEHGSTAAPLYSQEYVSALLAELEAKDEALRELAFRVSAGGYNADSVDAEVFKQKIIDGINSISAVLIKRIDELEAVKADASQAFKEIGNELGCNPDNESIMMAIDALKEREKRVVALAGGNADLWETMAARLEAAEAKLATPVRLPDVRQSSSGDRYQWSDGAHNYRLDVISMLLGAGFTVAVEGDA